MPGAVNAGSGASARDAEVDQADLAVEADHHVVGGDIAVDDPQPMGVGERSGDLAGHVRGDCLRNALPHPQGRGAELGERSSRDELLRDERLPLVIVDRERLRDRAVRQSPGDVRLAAKPSQALTVRERVGVEALDHAELVVPGPSREGQEHRSHAAASERPNENVGAPALRERVHAASGSPASAATGRTGVEPAGGANVGRAVPRGEHGAAVDLAGTLQPWARCCPEWCRG